MWPFKRASADPQGEFWSWFDENRDRLKTVKDGNSSVIREIHGRIKRVHKDLVFEFGIGEGEQWEFIVSADGIRELVLAVESLVRAAPEIPGWKILAFRQRKAGTSLQVNGINVDPESVWFKHQLGEGVIDLTLALPLPVTQDEKIQIAFLLLDAVLGEYDVMTKIGEFDFVPIPADPLAEGFQPLTELPKIIDSLM